MRLVQATYRNTKAVVRTLYGQADEFNLDVGPHQGSAFSPFLFAVVLEVVTEVCRTATPWELLSTDDLTLIAESEKELQEKWQNWQESTTKNGLKANTQKNKSVSSKEKTRANIMD